jgi:hypothetical protein
MECRTPTIHPDMITSLLAFAIRLALVAAMTFLFVVLFEHGPANYLENVKADFSKLVEAANPPAPAAPAAVEKSPNSGT